MAAMPLPAVPDLELYMLAAMEQARLAERLGEVPVGAVIVYDEQIIAAAGNRRETRRDPTAHAELIALQEAARRRGTWYLNDCLMVVTLEPCPMCAGALVNARVGGLAFGALDPKAGACQSLFDITGDARLNHFVPTIGGVLQEQCAELLKAFFRRLRDR